MSKEQIAHDITLVVLENLLEDVDSEFGVKQYSVEAVEIYKAVKETIMKELD